jgi:hypothetical protein
MAPDTPRYSTRLVRHGQTVPGRGPLHATHRMREPQEDVRTRDTSHNQNLNEGWHWQHWHPIGISFFFVLSQSPETAHYAISNSNPHTKPQRHIQNTYSGRVAHSPIRDSPPHTISNTHTQCTQDGTKRHQERVNVRCLPSQCNLSLSSCAAACRAPLSPSPPV